MHFDSDYYEISKDFKLLTFNKAVQERYKGIKVGDLCYKVTMKRDSPCLHCPIAGNVDSQCPIYFDPFYEDWVQADFTRLSEDTFAVICHPANQLGMEILEKEASEKLKNIVLGKAANNELQKILHEQSNIINGFKGIFFAAFIIDLEKKYFWKLFLKKNSAKITPNLEGFAEPVLTQMVEKTVALETRKNMERFNDLNTMAERIGDKGLLVQDFIGVVNGWCRAHLIPIERDDSGKVTKIIYGLSLAQGDFRDGLTNCNNRKALNWVYDKQNQTDDSIAVILCDINGLKKINDTQGHLAGDEYIKKAARIYGDLFGINNVYRLGGDEFIIVLLGGVKEEIGRRVLELKKQCELEDVNVSLGYEFYPQFDRPFEIILKAVDKKMYAAKSDYYKRYGLDNSLNSDLGVIGEYYDSLYDFGSSCYLVVRVDIIHGTYKVVHSMEGYDTSFISECESLKDILYYPIKQKVMFAEDVVDYERWVETTFSNDPESLEKMSARNESWIRFRSNYNKKKYLLSEALYFPGRNFSPENQYGYVYLKNKGNIFGKENVYFDEVLKNLSENFESILYVELDTMEVIPYRVSKYAAKTNAGKFALKGKGLEAIREYIDLFVADSDKEDLRRICTKEFLEEKLKVKPAYSRDYLAEVDGNEVYYRIKFANMDGPGELKHVAVGFANINAEVLHKRELSIRGSSILLIDDTDINREMLKAILEPEYKVLEASNGLEAQKILIQNFQEISLVITDLEMPECDGYILLEILQQNPFYKNIPVVVLTSHNEEDNKIRCLEMGAADYITKPYNRKIILNRIASILKLRGMANTKANNELDPLTGLYTRDAFYRYAQIVMESNPGTDYVIILSDVIGFKAINEQYGKEKGDEVLKFLATTNTYDASGFFVGGRLSGDVFACLLPESQISNYNEESLVSRIQHESPVPNLIVKYGFYYSKDGKNVSIQQMCDRADIALNSIKDEYGVFSAKYDETMRNNLLLEQQIMDSMEVALEEEQFEVYFQPKHNVHGKDFCGAETLIRWNHPVMGFMNPGLFIPLFEKNGFISRLDRFIWRKSCEEIAFWLKEGKAFPISINVSRKDFSDPHLAESILELTNEYNIPHHLLHIEVTESAYSDNPEQLKKIVGMLHSNGFVIELDDFGTGYSSLTAINSFDIDILKLDMSLIKNDFESEGTSVLEFSMQLAKMMNVKTIQEGVETEEEYNRMKALGCDYIQGFYFSKPLCKADFEKYVKEIYKMERKE
ncbi:MAG: EAL domain-containing protein [Treponema sp.]|nr:EAL domain-containing protein [Treponema sp.]